MVGQVVPFLDDPHTEQRKTKASLNSKALNFGRFQKFKNLEWIFAVDQVFL